MKYLLAFGGLILYEILKPSAKPSSIGNSAKLNEFKCFSSFMPVANIFVNTALFQNRENDFSEDSKNKIIVAVAEGRFNWAAFDAITIWLDPTDNKYYVLSGHSRYSAFKELASRNANFKSIPVKVFKGDMLEAQDFALNSNTLATPEKETERTSYYRKRIDKGEDRRSVKRDVTANEGSNASRIWGYTYLSPVGKCFTALKALEQKEATSSENIKVVAYWIGQLRGAIFDLSNLHEDEIYTYLISGKFGAQYRRYNDFKADFEILVAKRKTSLLFAPDVPLNIADIEKKTYSRRTYEAQVAEQKTKVADLCNAVSRVERGLISELPTQLDYVKVLTPHNDAVLREQYKLRRLLDKKQDVLDYSEKSEPELFGTKKR